MGEPVVSLNLPENWSLIHSDTIYAASMSNGAWVPILPFTLSTLAHSPLLIVETRNIDAKPWWFLGIRLQQIVEVGLIPGEIASRFIKIPINRPSLVRFPMYAAQYALRVEVPPWYRQMTISVWEYDAPVGDTTELLVQEQADFIRGDLVRIETKIDAL